MASEAPTVRALLGRTAPVATAIVTPMSPRSTKVVRDPSFLSPRKAASPSPALRERLLPYGSPSKQFARWREIAPSDSEELFIVISDIWGSVATIPQHLGQLQDLHGATTAGTSHVISADNVKGNQGTPRSLGWPTRYIHLDRP